jgi:hypothetical protein
VDLEWTTVGMVCWREKEGMMMMGLFFSMDLGGGAVVLWWPSVDVMLSRSFGDEGPETVGCWWWLCWWCGVCAESWGSARLYTVWTVVSVPGNL